jgi:site-specific recombinase XerD
LLLSHAIEEYLATKQNSITADTYRWYDRFLGWFEQWAEKNRLSQLSEIRATHMQEFVSACPTDNTHTRHARAQIVKGFLSWCAKDEETGVRRAVVDRIEMPKVIQNQIELLTERDIKRLLNACETSRHPHRNKAIIHLLLDTGVRASEICYDSERPGDETGLLLENLFLGRGANAESYIRVMGKGRKSRTIGLGQQTTLMVRRYLSRERQGINSDYVLIERDGQPLSVRMLEQFLQHLGDRAGVPNLYPHRFRHTFAVTQLLNGTSDLVLMRLMGHTTLASTQIYVRAMTQLQARNSAISIVDRIKSGKGLMR